VSNEGLIRTEFSAVVVMRIVMQRSSRPIDSVRFEVVLSTGKIVKGRFEGLLDKHAGSLSMQKLQYGR